MILRVASIFAFIAVLALTATASAQACAAMGVSTNAGARAAVAAPVMADHGGAAHHQAASTHHGEAPCPHGGCEPVVHACDAAPSVAPVQSEISETPAVLARAPTHPLTRLVRFAPPAPPGLPRPALSPIELFVKLLN